MTAPDTNVEKQTRRHKGSLGGIALAVVIMMVAVGSWIILSEPEETVDAQDTNAVTSAETTAAGNSSGQD